VFEPEGDKERNVYSQIPIDEDRTITLDANLDRLACCRLRRVRGYDGNIRVSHPYHPRRKCNRCLFRKTPDGRGDFEWGRKRLQPSWRFVLKLRRGPNPQP